MDPIQRVAPILPVAAPSEETHGPLVSLRDEEGRQVIKHWHALSNDERQEWLRRHRNFIRF